MSNWCQQQLNDLHLISSPKVLDLVVREYMKQDCYDNSKLRIFTNKPPFPDADRYNDDILDILSKHGLEGEDFISTVTVPILNVDMFYGYGSQDLFKGFPEQLVGFINKKFGDYLNYLQEDYKKHSFLSSYKKKGRPLEFNLENFLNLTLESPTYHDPLADFNPSGTTQMTVKTYLIELIAYILFHKKQPNSEHVENYILDPLHQIGEAFGFGEKSVPFQLVKENTKELDTFLKFFHGHTFNLMNFTWNNMFVFYFVAQLTHMITSSSQNYQNIYNRFLLTMVEQIERKIQHQRNDTINIFYAPKSLNKYIQNKFQYLSIFNYDDGY